MLKDAVMFNQLHKKVNKKKERGVFFVTTINESHILKLIMVKLKFKILKNHTCTVLS